MCCWKHRQLTRTIKNISGKYIFRGTSSPVYPLLPIVNHHNDLSLITARTNVRPPNGAPPCCRTIPDRKCKVPVFTRSSKTNAAISKCQTLPKRRYSITTPCNRSRSLAWLLLLDKIKLKIKSRDYKLKDGELTRLVEFVSLVLCYKIRATEKKNCKFKNILFKIYSKNIFILELTWYFLNRNTYITCITVYIYFN